MADDPNPDPNPNPDPDPNPNPDPSPDPGPVGSWPDNWRDQIADNVVSAIENEDERGERRQKLTSRLDRFESPAAFAKSYFALEGKVSSGELKAPLPKDATDEQIAAYRTEQGIPEKPEGYLEGLPEGLVLGDEDQAAIGQYLETMHGANLPPDVAHNLIKTYQDAQQARIQQIEEADADHAVEIEESLRAEFGGDYRQNLNRVEAMMKGMPKEVSEALQSARLADGRALLNVPGVMNQLVSMARELVPAIDIPLKGEESTAQGVEAALEEIRKVMRTDRAAYNKDEAMQKRYRELLTAKQKLDARSKAA